jgi:prevent-host-death family protein
MRRLEMVKKISAVKARQNLGQVMNEVALRGDDYIVERAGKPLVAIIPIEKYEELERDLDAFFNEVGLFRCGVRGVEPEDIDQAINAGVRAAKSKELKGLKRKR